MVLQRTLTVHTARVCAGKPKDAIVDEVSKAFPLHPVVAVQVGFDIVRVTFRDSDSCKLARSKSHINLFGSNCAVQGGAPPSTMVHLFDFPAELGDETVRQVFSGYGNVKSVRRQKYIGRPDIETGTRLILMTFRVTPPRSLFIGGYVCRVWYKGQPLVCNLCNEKGHKSVDCPNKDKCRRCGQSGHFARSCPNPWGPAARVESASSEDFPALGASGPPVLASGPAASLSGNQEVQSAAGASEVDRVVDEACDPLLTGYDLFGDIASISDDSEGSTINDSLDGAMEDANADIIENRNIRNDNDANVNETIANINTGSSCAVPVSTHSAPVNVDINHCENNEGNDIRPSATCNISNRENTTPEVAINVEMDDEVPHSRIAETGDNNNGVNDNVISNSNSNMVNVEHAAVEARETPARTGATVDSMDGATGDGMDRDVVPVSQVSEVDDEGIVEVLKTGFSGDRAIDIDAGTEVGPPRSPPGSAESSCSINDAQILTFSQEDVSPGISSSSQEEASQSILAPVVGSLEDPIPPLSHRRARSARRAAGRHDLPPVVPDVPSRSRPRSHSR